MSLNEVMLNVSDQVRCAITAKFFKQFISMRHFMKKVITINIGKRGINEGVINEINTILEKYGIVKVRMLRNFRSSTKMDKKELANEIARRVKGELVDFRGFVLTFRR